MSNLSSLVSSGYSILYITDTYSSGSKIVSPYSWTPLHLDGGLKQIFPNFMPVNLAKYGVTIIDKNLEGVAEKLSVPRPLEFQN